MISVRVAFLKVWIVNRDKIAAAGSIKSERKGLQTVNPWVDFVAECRWNPFGLNGPL
jgi:hypothetical protein